MVQDLKYRPLTLMIQISYKLVSLCLMIMDTKIKLEISWECLIEQTRYYFIDLTKKFFIKSLSYSENRSLITQLKRWAAKDKNQIFRELKLVLAKSGKKNNEQEYKFYELSIFINTQVLTKSYIIIRKIQF